MIIKAYELKKNWKILSFVNSSTQALTIGSNEAWILGGAGRAKPRILRNRPGQVLLDAGRSGSGRDFSASGHLCTWMPVRGEKDAALMLKAVILFVYVNQNQVDNNSWTDKLFIRS